MEENLFTAVDRRSDAKLEPEPMLVLAEDPSGVAVVRRLRPLPPFDPDLPHRTSLAEDHSAIDPCSDAARRASCGGHVPVYEGSSVDRSRPTRPSSRRVSTFGVIDQSAHTHQRSPQSGDQGGDSARLASRLDPVVHEQQPVIGPNRQRADAKGHAATSPIRIFGDLLDSTGMNRIRFASKYQANTECARSQRSQHESPSLNRNNARHLPLFERLNKRRTNVLEERSRAKNPGEISMRVGPTKLREKRFTSSSSRSGHSAVCQSD